MLIQRWWRVRLSGHGAFNDTVLAKQVWRIIKNEDSLVARLIKAKYYYDCDIFATPYEDFWTPRFRTLADCITNASHTLDDDAFGDLLAVMWECWNARNRFIFSSPDRNLATLGKCALDFVRSYHLHQETTPPPTWLTPLPGLRCPWVCKTKFWWSHFWWVFLRLRLRSPWSRQQHSPGRNQTVMANHS